MRASLLWFVCLLVGFGQCAQSSSVRIGIVGSMVGDIGQILLAAIDGLQIAVTEANLAGGISGRPLEIVRMNTNDDETMAPRLVDSMMENSSTRLDLLAFTPGRAHINAVIPSLSKHNLLLMCPVSGDRQDFNNFDRHLALFSPIPDAEIEALIRNLVLVKGVKRIAVATTRDGAFGNDLMPYIKRLLGELGMELVYAFEIDNPTKIFANRTKSNAAQIREARLEEPQALLLLGYLYPETAYFLLEYVVAFRNSFVALPGLLFVLSTKIYSSLPTALISDQVVVATQYTPLSYDSTFASVRNMRTAYESAAANMTYSLSYYDSDAAVSPFLSSGYLVGRAIVDILRRIGSNGITPESVLNEAFSGRVMHVDDWKFGPLSAEPCSNAVRDATCECHAGARRVLLGTMTNALQLLPIPSGSMYFSLDECIQSKTIQSPLIQLLPSVISAEFPNDLQQAIRVAVSGFQAGDRSGYVNVSTSPSSRTGIVVPFEYDGGVESLRAVQHDRLLTVSVGGVFSEDLVPHASNLTAVLDPLFVTPRLYAGYSSRIIHMMATLEQELHALASVYRGRLSVLSSDAPSIDGLSRILRLSVHTFGEEPLGVTYAATIAAELKQLKVADGAVVFVHGVQGEADIEAIATFLSSHPSAIIALPFHHLSLWYESVVRIVGQSERGSRLVFATNLPDWNSESLLPSSSTELMQSYYAAMRESGNRTSPRSLSGFLAQRVMANIVERIPSRLTQDSFLSTLFAVSVVVLSPGAFAIGPLSNVACHAETSSGSGLCEVNVGARVVQVRRFSQVAGGGSGMVDSFTFASGAIDYQPLPKSQGLDAAIIIAIALSAAVVLVLVIAIVVIMLCTGRSHSNAPKDSQLPFTIIFTDIQSSTNLWAEEPDAMGLALEIHHRLIRGLIRKHRGYEVKTIGDAFMIAFKSADDAVRMSYALQQDFYSCKEFPPSIDMAYLSFERERIMVEGSASIPNLSAALSGEEYRALWSGLRVRVGIHTAFGEIKKDEVTKAYDYYGTVTNTAARVEAVCHGGQVCFTEGTLSELSFAMATFVGEVPPGGGDSGPSVALQMGQVELRGLADRVTLYQLECVAGRKFPPLRLDVVVDDDDVLCDDTVGTRSSVNDPQGAPSQYSTNDNTSVAAGFVHHDIHSSQLVACIATLFSSVPADKRTKELKRLCELWRIRVDRRSVDKASVWGAANLKHRFGTRPATEEAITRCLSLHLAKDDATMAFCIESLARRVRVIASKSLVNAFTSMHAVSDLIPPPIRSRNGSRGDMSSQKVSMSLEVSMGHLPAPVSARMLQLGIKAPPPADSRSHHSRSQSDVSSFNVTTPMQRHHVVPLSPLPPKDLLELGGVVAEKSTPLEDS